MTRALKSLQAETAGSSLTMAIIPAAEGLRMLVEDSATTPWSLLFSHFMRSVHRAPRHSPVRCSCCSKPLKKAEFTVVLGLPRDNPRHGLVVAICDRCADEPGEVREKGRAALLAAMRGSVE